MHSYTHIANLFFGQPLLIQPSAAEVVASVLLARMGLDPMVDIAEWKPPDENASRFVGSREIGADGRPKPYRTTSDGTAIIDVMGELVNRGAWMGSSSGLTSYEGFSAQLRAAANDRTVHSIALDLESPGGQAQGAFEAAALVRQVAAEKPVIAIANGLAASAAYAIASASTRIITPPSGVVGSIGVVMVHLDRSGQLSKNGIKPTLIFAGAHKADGNPFEALPEDVRASFQAGVDRTYADFVKTVAAGRKGLSEDAVRATEARVYRGQDAVDVGLADAVGTFEEALAETAQRRKAQTYSTPMRMKMTETTAHGVVDPNAVSRSDHDAAVLSARKEGAKAESVRIKTILSSEEAKGRESLAQHLAFETDQSAEGAVALLGKAAKEQAEQPSTSYQERKDAAAGGNGLMPGANVPTGVDAKAGWAKHIANANRSNQIA